MDIEALRREVIAQSHPAANALPLMSDEELQRLADDIRATRLREPIFRDANGLIVDGRNRWIACRMAGAHCGEIAFGPDHGDPIDFVISYNIPRRHLNPSQLAVCAAELANLRHGTNQHSQKVDLSTDRSANIPTTSLKAAAEMVGASEPMARRAKHIARVNPEAIPEIKSGKKTIGAVMAEMGKATDAADKRKGSKRKHSKAKAPVIPFKLRADPVRDEKADIAEQVCALLLRLSEVAKKIGPEELYSEFPSRLRHNLDIALSEASFFVGDLHDLWVRDQAKKNAAG